MFPKTGNRRPKPFEMPSEASLAEALGKALQAELGGSRQATKTIMGWANVSDRTARNWLNGERCLTASSLIALAANSPSVLKLVLKLAGHDRAGLDIDLLNIEAGLEAALTAVRVLLAANVSAPSP